jgi:hypothetical protein
VTVPGIASGNAFADGQEFGYWFVGDFRKWCQERSLAFEPARYDLRETTAVEVKWGIHQAGERRPGGWVPEFDRVTLSVLVRGAFTLTFRHPVAPRLVAEFRLTSEGDYAIWRPGIEHSWQANADSVVLTVRWPAA